MPTAFSTVFLLFAVLQVSFAQTVAKNKQIVNRYFEEVINKQRIELIHELFSDEFTYHDLHNFTESKSSVKSFTGTMVGFFKAFPDAHYTVDNMIGEGDKVFAQITLTATHKADFMGIPASNNKLKITEMYLLTLQNDKIILSARLIDFDRFFKQISGK